LDQGLFKAWGTMKLPCHEYLQRMEEGRSFKCGGPFSPEHRCPKTEVKVMILA
jgi:hypothetical protein